MAHNTLVAIYIEQNRHSDKPQITFERRNNSMGSRYALRTRMRRVTAEKLVSKFPHNIMITEHSLTISINL